ncbi:MAG: DUF4491 family protein [Bacteroidales bacterium]|nr:DUF4491 family protein [Bacteroidales bacterium]
MNFTGIIVGAAVFLSIGICHPVTIKLEYYLGRKGWWIFFIAGLVCTVTSLLVENYIVSTVVAAFAFSCFWGIGEVFKQHERVRKGWFPMNPKRKDDYKD